MKYVIPVIMCVIIFVIWSILDDQTEFVRGKYGSQCYREEKAHGNIEYPVYYESREECKNSL